jgi:hypothetical protein
MQQQYSKAPHVQYAAPVQQGGIAAVHSSSESRWHRCCARRPHSKVLSVLITAALQDKLVQEGAHGTSQHDSLMLTNAQIMCRQMSASWVIDSKRS